jgi:hypothetical protein
MNLILRAIIKNLVLSYIMEEAPLLWLLGHEEAVVDRHELVVVDQLIMTVFMRKVGR